jgi:hypothetical protein
MNEVVGTQVRITNIDKYGMLGREFHPLPRHVGRHALVTGMEYIESDDVLQPNLVVYHAVTLTGELLELMSYEIESVYSGPAEAPGYSTL